MKTKNPQSESTLGVFVRLKVTLQGEVNSDSGMILNLKDVDFALDSVKKNFPITKSKPQAFFKLYQQLENLLGDYFYQLEMSWDQHTIVKNKKKTYRLLKTHVWFQESGVLLKRSVQLKYKKDGLPLIQKIRSVQTSCHIDDFKILMNRSQSGVSEIRIGYPEKNAYLIN